MKQFLPIFLILSPCFYFSSCIDYTKHKVYEVVPADMSQYRNLIQWQPKLGIDFLTYGSDKSASRVLVAFEQQKSFEKSLDDNKIKYNVEIENVDEILKDENIERLAVKARAASLSDGQPNFSLYWTYAEMEAYLHKLVKSYPKILKLDVIGHSIEKRNIYGVRISRNQEFGTNPIIFVDAGTHAREWVGHASAFYLIHQLVENSEVSNELTKSLDWVIVPVVNPDGYVYTWEEDRLWRKNRRYVNYTCNGIDLNRNYVYLWRDVPESCPTNNYPGAYGFSEPETVAMGKYMVSFKDNLRLYLSTHSAGNYILWPFGFKFDGYVKNYKEHQKLGERVANVVRNATGTDYLTGNAADILYTATGCSDDFALAYANADFSYTLELTPGGSGRLWHDFPQDRIFELVKETFLMYREFALYIDEKFNY